VEIVDPLVVRFHLKAPWPDFMTFFGTSASAAGLVLPKKYLTLVEGVDPSLNCHLERGADAQPGE
jgi:hypothetical protein